MAFGTVSGYGLALSEGQSLYCNATSQMTFTPLQCITDDILFSTTKINGSTCDDFHAVKELVANSYFRGVCYRPTRAWWYGTSKCNSLIGRHKLIIPLGR